jgi:transcriptional regulator with XRE-family HTH domain
MVAMNEVTFGDWLLDRRKAAGLTQDELAAAIGRDRSYIIKLEKGRIRLPTEPVRAEFHRVFETSEDDLLRLGIVKPERNLWLYEQHETGQSSTSADNRDQVAAMLKDPRIPDETIEGIRRVLLGYLGKSE